MASRLKLENFLPYRLVHLYQTVTKAFYISYSSQFNLTVYQWRVIALLGPDSVQALLDLVAVSDMDKVKVSRACERLSVEGFLSKQVDLTDRRKLKIKLTTKGKQAYQDFSEFATEWERQLLELLLDNERQAIHPIIITIYNHSSPEKKLFWNEPTPEDLISNFSLTNTTSYRFAIIAKLISENFSEVYRDRFGLTITEWRLIAVLAQYGPISAQESCNFAGLDKVKISRAITTLQKAKLINRVVDLSDRRKVLLSLPPKGKRTYQNISIAALEWEQEFVKVLAPKQLKILDQIINKIMNRFKHWGT